VILSILKGNITVGYYSPPSQLTDAVTLIPLAFMTSLFPLMSRYHRDSREALVKSFRLAMKYMLFISIPMAFGTVILSDRIIAAIYGADFVTSAPALAVMIWGVIFVFCGIVFGNLLVSINQQKKAFNATATTAIFNIALNILLIPYFGFMGAAFALVASQILIVLIYFHYLPKFLKTIDSVFIMKSILASIFMDAFIGYFKLNLYLSILLGACAYFIAIALLGGISGEDIEMFKKIW
jgi:O-antigen/teichoic acid export membrane protein